MGTSLWAVCSYCTPFDLVCEALLRDSVVDFGSVKVGSSGRRTQRIEVSCNNSAYYSLSVVGSQDGVLTFDEGRVLITRDDGQPLPIEEKFRVVTKKSSLGWISMRRLKKQVRSNGELN